MQGRLGSRLKRSADYTEYTQLPQKAKETGAHVNTLRKEFRERWAKKQWALVSSSKIKTDTHTERDSEIGTWLPLPRVIKEEGGYEVESAVKAGLTYCRKCVEMGSEWAMFNTMTERMEFYYIVNEKRTMHEKSRQLREESCPDTVKEEQDAQGPKPEVKDEEKPGKQGKREKRTRGNDITPKSKTKHQKVSDVLKQALKLKVQMASTQQEANHILQLVAKGEGSWGMTSERVAQLLEKRIKDLQAMVDGDVLLSSMMLTDVRELKKKGGESFDASLQDCLARVDVTLREVAHHTSTLKAQSAAARIDLSQTQAPSNTEIVQHCLQRILFFQKVKFDEMFQTPV